MIRSMEEKTMKKVAKTNAAINQPGMGAIPDAKVVIFSQDK